MFAAIYMSGQVIYGLVEFNNISSVILLSLHVHVTESFSYHFSDL